MDEKRLKGIRQQLLASLYCMLLFQLGYATAAIYASRLAFVPAFTFSFERCIPFIPWMILPYMSSGLFFALVPFLCRSRAELWGYAQRFSFITVVSICCFFIFPLRFSFDRPTVENPALGFFFTFLEKYDSPFNQAPSLHVAYACLFWSVIGKQLKGWIKWVLGIWLVLMGLATLTVYQHHLIDVITALILVHVGFILFPSPFNPFQGNALASGDQHQEVLSTIEARTRLKWEVNRRNRGIGHVYFIVGWIVLLLAIWGGEYMFGWYFLGWISLVCFAVGRSYFINNPNFLKNENGRIPWFKKVFYAPHQLAYWLIWRFARQKNNPPFMEVLPSCYVGPRASKADLKAFDSDQRLIIFDLAAELEEVAPLQKRASYCSFPLLDIAAIRGEDAERILAALVANYQQLQKDEKMMIHCTMGYSRSMVFAILLSQKILSLNLKDAINRVKSKNKHLVLHKHSLLLMKVLAGEDK